MHAITNIIQCLFEPFFIGGLLSIFLIFLRSPIRHRFNIYLFTIASVLLFVSWRFIIQIGSSRYAVILIFISIYLIVELFYSIDKTYRKKILNVNKPLLFWLLISIIVIISLIKNFRYNAYDDDFIKGFQIIQQDSKNFMTPFLLSPSSEQLRYEYYAKIPTLPLEDNSLESIINRYTYLGDVLYGYMKVPVSTELTAQLLGMNDDEFSILQSSYSDNRKKYKNVLFRCTPSIAKRRQYINNCDNITSNQNNKNLLKNGLFESNIIEEKTKLPKEWQIPNQLDTLAENNNILIKGENGEIIGVVVRKNIFNLTPIVPDNYTLSVFIEGQSGSLARIELLLYGNDYKYINRNPIFYVYLDSYDLIEIKLPISTADFNNSYIGRIGVSLIGDGTLIIRGCKVIKSN